MPATTSSTAPKPRPARGWTEARGTTCASSVPRETYATAATDQATDEGCTVPRSRSPLRPGDGRVAPEAIGIRRYSRRLRPGAAGPAPRTAGDGEAADGA